MPTGKQRKSGKNSESHAESAPAVDNLFPIVGVGASAGGIEAFTTLLKNLPADPGMSFIFVLHQDPTHASNLDHVLERSTKLPVETVRPGMLIKINHIYIAPPDAEVSVKDRVLQLHARAAGLPSSVDGFFRSLAEDQGARAISVVLSGSASDGSLGTEAIKAEGGITFAQDDSAKMDSMPRSAAAGGGVDFVLSPEQIAEELVRIARHEYITRPMHLPEEDLRSLFVLIRSKHDIDFSNYKPSTIERRVRRRMAVNKVSSLHEYLTVVRDSDDEVEQLYADILIRVTGFFRDPDVFDALQQDIFPPIMRKRVEDESLRVWVPGCATGEEVYSLAIAALETAVSVGFKSPIQIFGTDISDLAIERARAGLYSESAVSNVPEERLKRFFHRVDGACRVSKAVRDCCVFARQNVTKDPPFSKLDFISCRNLMIYFGTSLQRRVLSIFHYALRADGYLLLGTSESVGNFTDLFAIIDRKRKIYRKKPAIVRRGSLDFTPTRPEIPRERPERSLVEQSAATGVSREADHVLLARFSPTGVVVNEDLEVVQFRGHTSRYLEPPPGAASFSLFKMARKGLLGDLRAAIHKARSTETAQRREDISVQIDDHSIRVNIEVIPFLGPSNDRFLVILFDEPPPEKKTRGRRSEKSKPDSKRLERLKAELEATREYLQTTIEEQEAMNEELRAANEEIQSSNEELQSTNEELETAKEELQSTNEELTTLNEELENRNEELALANNDLINLLTSVEIPILMLDGELRIRRFNPRAQRSLNLLPSDLGRPIGDLNLNLEIHKIGDVIREVMETLEVREIRVNDRAGRRHSLRIRPYKTMENKIDGVVLVLLDLEEFAKEAARLSPADGTVH